MDRLVAVTCAVIAIALPCLAQDQARDIGPRPTLLVLKNGRVVTGIITARPGGYDVRKAVGTMFISSLNVRFQANNMADAYKKMRSTFKEFTPEVHIEIARWCIANNQVPAARQELLDALNLEPHNSTARSILKRLEAAEVARSRPPTPVKTVAQRRMDQFLRSEHESLGGLTAKQAAAFTSRIQPIVERRCGNASCHGSSANNDFRLKRTRGNSSALTSERNLAMVLKQIDFKRPADSAFLRVLNEPHTRDGRPVLPGRSGDIQKKIIVDWVYSVTARDGTTPATRGETRFASATSKVAVPSTPTEPKGATRKLTSAEKKTINEVRESNENDPFDPAEFNRRHHGFQKTARQQSKR